MYVRWSTCSQAGACVGAARVYLYSALATRTLWPFGTQVVLQVSGPRVLGLGGSRFGFCFPPCLRLPSLVCVFAFPFGWLGLLGWFPLWVSSAVCLSLRLPPVFALLGLGVPPFGWFPFPLADCAPQCKLFGVDLMLICVLYLFFVIFNAGCSFLRRSSYLSCFIVGYVIL